MRRLLCCFFLVGIFTPLLVSAQIILQSLEEVSVREQAGYNAAMRWSAIHNFPASIYLPNGSVLGIIRMEGPYPVYFTTHNDAAARITQTSRLHAGISGNQFQGSTMEMGIWDEGAVYETHQELDGRIFIQDNDNISNHATHVAGTLVAAGMQPEARGMAPNAQLQSFNWNFHASEMGAAANTGLLLSNHSYGRVGGWHAVSNGGTKTWYWFGNPDISQTEDFSFGFYDRDAFLFDNVTYFNPYYLPIVSAGNERDDKGPASGGYKALDGSGRWLDFDIETRPVEADGGADGYDSITSMALAKNALTVGSVGATAPNEFNLSAFSSTGPTDDGRIKPDLMGIGEGVLSSTAAGPAAYGRSSGTSMATPNVAGSLLLLQEMAITLHGQPLRAATLKALALHTAKDLGAPGPDYQHGWGLLNTAAAAEHLDAAFRREGRLQEQAISSAQVWEEELVKQSSGPLRITLSWTDPPGPTPESRGTYVLNDRTPMLTNDLDVVLEHKASEHLYYPFVLDPETPQLPAQQGDNLVDPIEQIFTEEAPAGTYTVRVSHKATLHNNAPQSFSLLLTGIERAKTSVEIDSAYAEPAIGSTMVTWETLVENRPGHFIIERSHAESTSAISGALSRQFAKVVELPGRGNTAAGTTYAYSDAVYLTGQYVYRILFVGADTGTRTLLRELEVAVPAPMSFAIQTIFPNPAIDETQVVVDLPEELALTYAAFDLLGRMVVTPTKAALGAGRHFIPFDTATWAPGIYFIRISAGQQHLVRKLVVM